MIAFTRNPSGRLVLEKADTSFNTGNLKGFRVSPNLHPSEPDDFACLRPRRFPRANERAGVYRSEVPDGDRARQPPRRHLLPSRGQDEDGQAEVLLLAEAGG